MNVPAWMLVVVALLVVWLLVKQRRAPKFEPFRVTLVPTWRALLDDHLDMTPERWQAAEQWIASHPGDASRLWRDGLTFTVLRDDAGGRLTHITHANAFQSSVDWTEALPGVCWPPDDAAQRFGHDGPAPRFILRERGAVYELAIGVFSLPMLHPSKRAAAVDHDDHRGAELVIARLPAAAFRAPGEIRTRQALADAGWTIPARDLELFGAPFELQHAYAQVRFRYV
jgi:hypothetical protein